MAAPPPHSHPISYNSIFDLDLDLSSEIITPSLLQSSPTLSSTIHKILLQAHPHPLRESEKPFIQSLLLFLPHDKELIHTFLDKYPDIALNNGWFLHYLHKGNPENIPYIVSHRLHREFVYQHPKFLTRVLPEVRHNLQNEDSYLAPGETPGDYYIRLSNIQKLIDSARPVIAKTNWTLVYSATIFVIRARRFLQKHYEPPLGRGYLAQLASWERNLNCQ
jgi:hypothetical protein